MELQEFKSAIQMVKDAEMDKKTAGEPYEKLFDSLTPPYLGQMELQAYELVRNGISAPDFASLKEAVFKKYDEVYGGHTESPSYITAKNFWGYLEHLVQKPKM